MPEVTFKFNVNELNIILAGLAEIPFKVAAPMIEKIRTIAEAEFKKAQSEEKNGAEVVTD